jgi:hypothetical protein
MPPDTRHHSRWQNPLAPIRQLPFPLPSRTSRPSSLVQRRGAPVGREVIARMLPIGPGGLQSGFSTLFRKKKKNARRDFRKKKIGSADSPPPVLGSLGRRAEGLPSTRIWPFRWPLPPTSPPQVTPKAVRAASWPGRCVVFGAELRQRSHTWLSLLGWSAEGLSSTRIWPYRWALPPTSSPQPR